MKTKIRIAAFALAASAGLTGAAVAQAPPLCGVEGTGAATPGIEIRVGTYNVLHGLGELDHVTLDERLEIVAQEIAAKADVVGMQEVSNTEANENTQHTDGNVAQRLAEQLSDITGTAWSWCWYMANPHIPGEPDIKVGGGGPISDEIAKLASGRYAFFQEGVAIVSRYPITASQGLRLPGRNPAEFAFCEPPPLPPSQDDLQSCYTTAAVESRAAIWARVDTPGGATDIISTHLSNNITAVSDLTSVEQAVLVLALSEVEAALGTPARRFLTCDCNVEPDATMTLSEDPAVEIPAPLRDVVLTVGWSDTHFDTHGSEPCTAGDPSGCTSDQQIDAAAQTTDGRIDYVFWKPGTCENAPVSTIKMGDTPADTTLTLTQKLWGSDHHGVVTTVPVSGCE